MTFLEYLDRVGERRNERLRIQPSRPRDTRMLVGSLFFAGYYIMIFVIMQGKAIPVDNASLVKDGLLVLGPIVGMIAQALFRTDVKDQIATENTGEFARATTAQAQATIAAAAGTPATVDASQGAHEAATMAATEVAQAATDKAEEYKE